MNRRIGHLQPTSTHAANINALYMLVDALYMIQLRTAVLGLSATAASSLPGASAAPSPAFQALCIGVSAGNVLARSHAARCGNACSTGITWRVASMRSRLRAMATRVSTTATGRTLTPEEQEREDVLAGGMASEKLYVLGSKEAELSQFVSWLEKSKLNLFPEYQREYVWKPEKASRLIATVLCNRYVPPIPTGIQRKLNFVSVRTIKGSSIDPWCCTRERRVSTMWWTASSA